MYIFCWVYSCERGEWTGGILRACIPYLYSVVIDGDPVDLVRDDIVILFHLLQWVCAHVL